MGQIDPMKYAQFIRDSAPAGSMRHVEQVRLYTGLPDPNKEPKTYGACLKQINVWQQAHVKVISRPLKYPSNWPMEKARQKGVDVALAIDFVALALDGKYDVGVIASTDTDLKPALEYVQQKCPYCFTEVTSWDAKSFGSFPYNTRLSIPGKNLWCTWVRKSNYDQIADLTDYNI